MEQINVAVTGVQMTDQPGGKYYLVLFAANDMLADMLQKLMGQEVALRYIASSSDLNFQLVVEMPGMQRYFEVPLNAHSGTLRWLDWIDEKRVTHVWAAYRDGKGGMLPYGTPTVVIA